VFLHKAVVSCQLPTVGWCNLFHEYLCQGTTSVVPISRLFFFSSRL
jgi:hypothetical protein